MYLVADGLARLLAPILPVTADELWRVLPGPREDSVHLADFPGVDGLRDDELVERWERLLKIRDEVNAALERQRKDKVIGNSLAARVAIRAGGADAALLERYREDLPMLFIVSQVELATGVTGDGLSIIVSRAEGVKCERCWRYVPAVSADPERPGICDRCQDALAAPVGK